MPRYKVPDLKLKTVKKIIKKYNHTTGEYEDYEIKIPLLKNLNSEVLASVLSNGNKLEMELVHVCKTTHCRAGWTIHVCGKQGYQLEKECENWEEAASLILKANYPDRDLPSFYSSNENGMLRLLEDAKYDYDKRTKGY